MGSEDQDPDTCAEGDEGVGGSGVTDAELAVLELEREFWKYPGAKEATIQYRFGWTPARYYQVLNSLIDRPDALAADPVTVNRLRRLRDKRRQKRNAPTSGPRDQ